MPQTEPLIIDMPAVQESIIMPLRSAEKWLDRALLYGVLALLMFGPLAFGTTEPWSQFVQRMAAVLLLALWCTKQVLWGSIEVNNSTVLLPAVIFFGFIVMQFATGRTAYRYATLSAMLNIIPCGVLMLVAGEIFCSRRRVREFVLAMSVFGFAIAVFALVQDLSHSEKIYWLVTPYGVSTARYGPYANHNHYAGLMEMLVPLAGAAAVLERGGKRVLLLFAMTMMAVSIILSRSRGGMLGLVVEIVLICVLLFRMNGRRRATLTVIAIVAAVVLLALLVGNDSVISRVTEAPDNYRLAIYRDCLRMWVQKPVFGFGWGTFSTVYPQYRSFFTNLFVNNAHNDYLELLVEMGLAGMVLAGWFLFAVFRGGLRKIFDQDDYEGSVLAVGMIAGMSAILAHSMLDFNLHIPANAALFYALCAAAASPYRRQMRQLLW